MFLFHNTCSQMALKQGNQLQMQVHEGCGVDDEASPPVVAEQRPVVRAGKKPLAHYSSLVRVLGSIKISPSIPYVKFFHLLQSNLQSKTPKHC